MAAAAAGVQSMTSHCAPRFHSRVSARTTAAFSPVAGATRLWPLPELVNGRPGAPATCAARRRAGAGGLRMGFSRRDPDSPRGFKGLVYRVGDSAKMVAQVLSSSSLSLSSLGLSDTQVYEP